MAVKELSTQDLAVEVVEMVMRDMGVILLSIIVQFMKTVVVVVVMVMVMVMMTTSE